MTKKEIGLLIKAHKNLIAYYEGKISSPQLKDLRKYSNFSCPLCQVTGCSKCSYNIFFGNSCFDYWIKRNEIPAHISAKDISHRIELHNWFIEKLNELSKRNQDSLASQ